MSDEKATNPLTIAHLRCKVGETLQGGCCELAGEVEFDGLPLCGRHARELEIRDRIDLLRGIASSLELCLSSVPLRNDANFASLLRSKRAKATRELDRAYEDLRQVEKHGP